MSAVPNVKGLSHLPIIVDPSHATGRPDLIPAMARASVAAGADGVHIEVHSCPEKALSDGPQALLPPKYAELMVETPRAGEGRRRHVLTTWRQVFQLADSIGPKARIHPRAKSASWKTCRHIRESPMRTKFIAGNWKMFTNAATGEALAEAIAAAVRQFHQGARRRLSAGSVPGGDRRGGEGECRSGSAARIAGKGRRRLHRRGQPADAQGRRVPIRHPRPQRAAADLQGDRRAHQRKLALALTEGLEVILCIGETLDERKGNITEKILDTQLTGCLANVSAAQLEKIVIAYEPVWAIGTGLNATPQQAQEAHAFVRRQDRHPLRRRRCEKPDHSVRRQRKRENVATLLVQPDVDGALSAARVSSSRTSSAS